MPMSNNLENRIKSLIREVPDFPKPGINFFDITTVLGNEQIFSEIIDTFAKRWEDQNISAIVGIESRGFIFGAALAYALKRKFVPVRKPGKLPAEAYRVEYDLEYGTDRLEMHKDALSQADRVVIVDDVLATGGTVLAATKLVQMTNAKILGLHFLMELGFLKAREKLRGLEVEALVKY